MAVSTAAGTTIGISADTPATFDAAGYAALTFTTIGEITDAGSSGSTYAAVTHSPLGTRIVQKFKGSRDEGTRSITMALDNEDAGQILAREALHDDADYSFAVMYPDGSADYFQAKVMSFSRGVSGPDTVISATMDVAITGTKDGVGIVEVLEPVTP